MDIIFLGGLEATTIIGIYDWERETKQTLVLDIEMAFDIKKAAERIMWGKFIINILVFD